jgi:uncharacterized protein (TIGR03437 family)
VFRLLFSRLAVPLAVAFILEPLAVAGPSAVIAHLPGVQINVAKVDAAGNIYFAGRTTSTAGSIGAYISKLSPDGSTTFYAIALGGSGTSTTAATALEIDSTGAVYVAGTTTAADFPVTPGAAQTSGNGFAVKLDAQGSVTYATRVGDSGTVAPSSVAVNSAGELVVSGAVPLPASSPELGAVANTSGSFLLKLSADGTKVFAASQEIASQGIAGLVAIDGEGNVGIVGTAAGYQRFVFGGYTGPTPTPGAFQGIPGLSWCGGTLAYACSDSDQYVASLTSDLGSVRFLTYLTGTYGTEPASVAVDAQGDILVAGTTYSPDYPTTSGSLQPAYSALISVDAQPRTVFFYNSPTGYVSLLKSDGTALVFSTFFGGTNNDTLGSAALTGTGIHISGQAGSTDLPGFNGVAPPQCLPHAYTADLTVDGSTLLATHAASGTPLAYDSTTGTWLLDSGSDLVRFDPSFPANMTCVLASADFSPATAVAPGELVSIFGAFAYEGGQPVGVSPVDGSFPASGQAIQVTANGIPAPLLYISQNQVNAQVPYEVAGSSDAGLTLAFSGASGQNVSDSRTLQFAASNPVLFGSSKTKEQGWPYPPTPIYTYALTLNADGTVNSESNPAAAGSVVTTFVDGLGVTDPAPVTGLVNPSPGAPLSLAVQVTPACIGCAPPPTFLSANSLPGAISGVTQVQFVAPANPSGGIAFTSFFFLVDSVPLPEDGFWVK